MISMICHQERRSIFWARHLAHRLVGKLKRQGDFPQGPKLVAFPNDLIGRELALAGGYEPAGILVARWLCEVGVVECAAENAFVDIGANIGIYSLELADHFAEVVAFEPHPVTFKLLEINVEINAALNVKCMQLALSDRNGIAELVNDSGDNAGASSLERKRLDGVIGGCHQVIVERGADAITTATNRRVSLLKIDVEGHELKVIGGLIPLLEKDAPVLAFEANTPAIAQALEAQLRKLGYVEFVALDYSPANKVLWVKVLLLTLLGVRYSVRSIPTLAGTYSLVFALQAHHATRWRELIAAKGCGGI